MADIAVADGLWSIRRVIEAEINDAICPVYDAQPQGDPGVDRYVIFMPLTSGPLELSMTPTIRLSAIARASMRAMEAMQLASDIAGVFSIAGKRRSFPLYDKSVDTVVGTATVTRVSVEAPVTYPEGIDLIPVDVTFRFRTSYAPRV